jgi:protease-4
MTKKSRQGLIIFILIMLLAAAISALAVISVKTETLPVNTFGKEYVAVLDITGVIEDENYTYNQYGRLETIDKLKNDRKNIGILLHINSPGGAVYEADDAYLALMDYAASGKQLRAYLGQIAASGGYYIACAANHITANRNTLTGSIGVIAGQSVDLSELFKKYGIRITTITAGKNKNMMNFDSPLTDEQHRIMQSIADESYEQFVGIVADSRGLSPSDVKMLADGRVYTASQALGADLIDDIDSFDNSLNHFLDMLSEFRDENVQIATVYYAYTGKNSFADMFLRTAGLLPNVRFPAYYYRQ